MFRSRTGRPRRDRQYGPLGDAPHTLGEHFDAYDGEAIISSGSQWSLWGDRSTDLLWRAKMRLHFYRRLIERYDRWKTREKVFAPAAYEDLWRALIAVISAAVGFVLGRF